MADIIQLLPDHVANQIAAGEVVQRPASGVKELLENAIDAKATEITLFIKDAGKTLIQVTDNGVGMSTTDARL
ncbi:MAG TPA: DNA mismatch repair protein MutL, partial [Aequorivita sp.]|nr:DNA mismatch repair protein MutL [Aequorivita sp.]